MQDLTNNAPVSFPYAAARNQWNAIMVGAYLGENDMNPAGHVPRTVHLRGSYTATQVNNPSLYVYIGSESFMYPLTSGDFDVTFNVEATRWEEWLAVEVTVAAEGDMFGGGA